MYQHRLKTVTRKLGGLKLEMLGGVQQMEEAVQRQKLLLLQEANGIDNRQELAQVRDDLVKVQKSMMDIKHKLLNLRILLLKPK